MEENWKPAKVRYKESGPTDGQTVAHGRVVMTNGAKNVEIVSVSVILTVHGPQGQALAAEASGSGVLVVGRWVAAIKGANGEDSGCSIAGEQLRSGKRKKREEVMGASKAPGSTGSGS